MYDMHMHYARNRSSITNGIKRRRRTVIFVNTDCVKISLLYAFVRVDKGRKSAKTSEKIGTPQKQAVETAEKFKECNNYNG